MTARVEGPGWHWEADSGGEGLQHLALTSEQQREALRAQLRESNGDPTLEIVDASAPGYAERAAALFRRDGFVAVSPAMSDAQLEALRAKALQVAGEIVALDQHGGQKGVGRFMFGGSCSFSGSQMHQREFAMMAELPVVDAVLSEIWGTKAFFCTGSGGDIAMPGSEYQPLHSVGLRLPPFTPLPPPPVPFFAHDPSWSPAARLTCECVVRSGLVDRAAQGAARRPGPRRGHGTREAGRRLVRARRPVQEHRRGLCLGAADVGERADTVREGQRQQP